MLQNNKLVGLLYSSKQYLVTYVIIIHFSLWSSWKTRSCVWYTKTSYWNCMQYTILGYQKIAWSCQSYLLQTLLSSDVRLLYIIVDWFNFSSQRKIIGSIRFYKMFSKIKCCDLAKNSVNKSWFIRRVINRFLIVLLLLFLKFILLQKR